MVAPESPLKRAKLTPLATPTAVAAAAADVIATEPALLELIVSFIAPDAARTDGQLESQVVLQTVASLCRALPSLGRQLSPANEGFWRSMVLAHFKFSLSPYCHNVRNVNDIGPESLPSAFFKGHEDANPEEWQAWCRHPAKAPLDAWVVANPDMSLSPSWFLEESYEQWEYPAVHFRPSQYDFLHNIQVNNASVERAWPKSEQAFSLFCDLVLLQTLVRPQYSGFETYSDGAQYVTPCLLSRLDADLERDGGHCEMLRHLSLLPHFWTAGVGVSHRWTGLDGPLPSIDIRVRPDEDDTDNKDEGEDKNGDDEEEEVEEEVDEEEDTDRSDHATIEELGLFPCSSARDFVTLRRLVYEHCDDWRRIHVNQEEEVGPEFYIGRSKRSGRWFGLVGQSDYCSDS